MMYGFGDVETPLPETVALVEVRAAVAAQRSVWHAAACTRALMPRRLQEMVCDYVTGLMTAATERANLRHGKATAEDVVAVMTKADPAKAARARELLTAHEELHRAQKIIHGDGTELEKLG
jgi:hypothetical protein